MYYKYETRLTYLLLLDMLKSRLGIIQLRLQDISLLLNPRINNNKNRQIALMGKKKISLINMFNLTTYLALVLLKFSS